MGNILNVIKARIEYSKHKEEIKRYEEGWKKVNKELKEKSIPTKRE